jgi:hypothetical protein
MSNYTLFVGKASSLDGSPIVSPFYVYNGSTSPEVNNLLFNYLKDAARYCMMSMKESGRGITLEMKNLGREFFGVAVS